MQRCNSALIDATRTPGKDSAHAGAADWHANCNERRNR
jgi:hypothetical protein